MDWPPHAKAPMTVNGHLSATMDPDQIKLWWTKWPNAVIGARVPDNCIVIDIDPRNAGSIEALEEFTGPLPATLTVWSGRMTVVVICISNDQPAL
jgi:hypothetical protein